MPPKKKNAFFSFMLDYKRDNKIESQEEAMEKADVIWRSMTEAEKKMYAGRRGNNRSRNDDNVPLNPVEIRINEEAAFNQKMIEEISSDIEIAKKYNNLPKCQFFIIHMNSLCMHTQSTRHYPCEIGISCFSLNDGVSQKDVYDAIIYPGPLPYGYTAIAKQISNESHQIPWDYGDFDNQQEIFDGLVKFLMCRSKGSRKLPVLYARPNNMELVQIVLDTWCEDLHSVFNFTVYNARTLFTLLHRNVVENSKWSSESIGYLEFEKDIHQYAEETACEYHKSVDSPVDCSRSIAIRSCYMICQNVCPGLGIDLIPGEHIPFHMIRNSEVKKKSSKVDDGGSSTIREDSSDIESLVSLGRSSTYVEDSTSSIGFPEYDGNAVSSKIDYAHMSGSSNYFNNLSSRTGSSGFSRKPAALPSNVNDAFSNLTMSQESTEIRKEEFPRLRGRGGAVPKGRGRGTPFRK